MKYLSVCSGIEAASVAWKPFGWKAVGFSEIEKFPAAVLAHHYPDVPNFGDMTKFEEWPDDLAPDVLVGGTPCQSFSVAGLRKGLDDPRGNLMLTFGSIARRYRPEWLVWENVPGVLSSNGGRDFGTFLGMLAELGYGFAYRVLDAQYFGVAQRRRRVFVVANARDWRRAAAVLFERHSLSGHPAPRRESGEGTAEAAEQRIVGRGITGCLNSAGGRAVPGNSIQDVDQGFLQVVSPLLANTLTARMHKGINTTCDEGQTLIPMAADVAHTLRGEGFDASEDGTGRGTPLVPVAFDTTQITSPGNYSSPRAGDPCHPLTSGGDAPAIAFSCKDHGADAGELSPTLRAMGHGASHANGGGQVAVAFGGQMSVPQVDIDLSQTLQAKNPQAVAVGWRVRRITPVEAERLQGFPDGYTAIPWRGKPADKCPDGPRYKALGNSMAEPVMRWIGERIEQVARIGDGD